METGSACLLIYELDMDPPIMFTIEFPIVDIFNQIVQSLLNAFIFGIRS